MVGIAGLGRSGWGIHARLLETLKDRYRIAAVLDLIPERRSEATARLGCRAHESWESFLDDGDVELVINALPSTLHTPRTVSALQAGKSVVCEKPMALSARDADRMIAAARRSGRLLTIFQNRRYDPDFVAVRRVIDSGVLGRIIHVRTASHSFKRRWDWQTLQKHGGGELNNNCPHPVDQCLLLMGDVEPEVFCIRDRVLTLGDAEDHNKIVLRAKGAPTTEIEVTHACAYPQDRWLVMGSRGGLRGDTKKIVWKYFKPDELPPRELDERPTPDRSYNQDSFPTHEETWTLEADTSPGHAGFYLDLYEAVRNGKPVPVTPESVRRQIRVFDECRKQAPI